MLKYMSIFLNTKRSIDNSFKKLNYERKKGQWGMQKKVFFLIQKGLEPVCKQKGRSSRKGKIRNTEKREDY